MPPQPQPPLYFNEINDYAARWINNIWPNSRVDRQSIISVDSTNLQQFDRVHLFAGIGGWEHALELSEWGGVNKVWTGSCPCQPFSVAGKQKGTSDERHLWPEMFRLIEQCHPPTVFGEQVAGKRGLEWFDGVRTDLEEIGYSVGMAVLPAASVGAPHKRDRIFWVAHAKGTAWHGTIVRSYKRAYNRVLSKNWQDYNDYACTDGKIRRTSTRIQPLASRVPGDLEKLRAYGNAIVPQVAALFIRSFIEVMNANATTTT